jgi:hypothetical protein
VCFSRRQRLCRSPAPPPRTANTESVGCGCCGSDACRARPLRVRRGTCGSRGLRPRSWHRLRPGPLQDGRPRGGQHAQDLHRWAQGSARHAPGRRRADRRGVQARRRRRQHRPALPAHQAPRLHRPRQRAALRNSGGAADRVLRPLDTGAGVERLRGVALAALRARDPARTDPVHPRGAQRRREGPPVRRLPSRARLGAGRLDREDGRRHQHPDPGDRTAPPRLPVAPRRHRTARGPDPAPGQPEPPGRNLPLRRGAQLRRLLVADRRAKSQVHQPGQPRPARRPPGRRHRRQHTLLHRGQSVGLRRPAAARVRPRRQRADQAPAPADARGSATGNCCTTPPPAPPPASRHAPATSTGSTQR